MATNNAINGGDPLKVSDGGLGVASHTTFSPICGGTVATGNFQNVASLGNSGDVLTSNGSLSLPSFQAPGGSGGNGYAYVYWQSAASTPADATAYNYIYFNGWVPGGGNSTKYTYAPSGGTITAIYGQVTCTPGSAQTSTMYIRVNNTTDHAFDSGIDLSSSPYIIAASGLSISLSAGDFFNIKWITPTWAPTNPTNVRAYFTVYIS